MDLSTYLDRLFQKSSIPPSELRYFLSEMRKTASGPLITSKLLAQKIQSPAETQALRAFDFLELALGTEAEGSIEFRTEIGRYRFLNELIRILSPKYYGTQTVSAVKDRAIKFLTDAAGSKRKQWFPSEHSKIDAVYNSLVDGGIILPNAVDPDAEFQKSIFERGKNAILLKKLLQSKDPSDLQAANRLIKSLVDEEAKRNERRSEIHSLIDRIETSTTLLNEMCSQSQIDSEIVDELASTCRTLRNKLGNIGTETNEETSSLLQASENIEKALNYYEDRKTQVNVTQGTEDLIEHPSLETSCEVPSLAMSLADELLIGMDLGPVLLKNTSNHNGAASEALNLNASAKVKEATNLLNFDIDLGVTQSLPHAKEAKLNEEKRGSGGGLKELELISRQLMQQGLTASSEVTRAFTTTNEKITLNQLLKQTAPPLIQNSPSNVLPNQLIQYTTTNSPTVSNISLLDLDFLEKSSTALKSYAGTQFSNQDLQIEEDESVLLVLEKEAPSSMNPIERTLLERDDDEQIESVDSIFSLDEIQEVDLEEVEFFEELIPVKIPLDAISSHEKELIDLSFTFGTLPGIPNSVKVTIITLTNRNPIAPLSDYGFQLLPPKAIQMKLFPPSSAELNPWKKKFLPPSFLTQVALIRVPEGKSLRGIKLKFILSFYLGDETALYNSEFELPC